MKNVNDEEKLVKAIMKDDALEAQNTLEKIMQKKCANKIMRILDNNNNNNNNN